MNLGLLYRQGSDILETNTAELAGLCAELGASIICPKAADGDSWQGDFDHKPGLRIADAAALTAQHGAYAALGLSLHPWVVPRGLASAADEAALHAEIARICGTVIVDFEYLYAGFFGRRSDKTLVFGGDAEAMAWAIDYFTALRAGAPGRQIVLSVDHRQQINQDYPAPALAPFCDAVAPQVYWTDFGREPIPVLNEAGACDFGGLPFRPMLPANGAPDDTEAALDHLAETLPEVPPTVYIFQRVTLNSDNVGVFSAFGAAVAPQRVGAPQPI